MKKIINNISLGLNQIKTKATFLILFIGLCTVNGQTYKSAFKSDICSCLEEESLKRELTENAYKKCFRETLPTYAAQIDAQIVEEDLNQKYYKGQLARKDLVVSMQYELIYSCEVYYNYLNDERISKKLIAREHAKESDLELYNQQVALTPNAMTYFMRAQLQFNLGNIKEAEADINRSLSVNPNKENTRSTRHELLLLAWIYEEQERFSEAVTLYDKIYFGDYDTQVARLRAMADKKGGGIAASIPNIGTKEINKEVKSKKRGEKQGGISTSQETGKQSNKTDKAAAQKVEKKKDTATLRKLLKIDN